MRRESKNRKTEINRSMMSYDDKAGQVGESRSAVQLMLRGGVCVGEGGGRVKCRAEREDR